MACVVLVAMTTLLGDPTLLMVESLVFFQLNDVDAPTSDITDSPPSATTPNFDFIGPEMADLQQLLVSMVTGKGIEIASGFYWSMYITKVTHFTCLDCSC